MKRRITFLGENKMKLLFFDCETSGLDPIKNDILTLAMIIEIDGEVKEEVYLEIQPFNWDTITDEALQVNGLKREQIKTFLEPKDAYKKIVSLFSKYINKYNKTDKFIAIGHNTVFDVQFLSEFFKKNGDKYFGSFVDYHYLDTMQILNLMKYAGVLQIENVKLVTASAKFGIDLTEAHNSMADIKATKELFKKLMDKIEFKKEV